jgi:TolB-like protein/Tfp pilus assembly protein PilF
VKVLDFGLAKLSEHQWPAANSPTAATLISKTGQGVVMGTARYMSPEQARGLKTDARTDIWSLGIVLYEMITGRAPFEGATTSDVIASILKTDPPALTDHGLEAPIQLQSIVDRALCKERAERYQMISDVALDLKRLRREVGDAHSEQSASSQRREGARSGGRAGASLLQGARIGREEARRSTLNNGNVAGRIISRKWILLIALLATTLAVAGVTSFYFGRDERTINSIAVLPFANDGADPDADYLSDGVTETTINSLSRVPGLAVIARSSIFRYKGREVDPQTAARELGVEAVLTGRVVERDGTLLISAELVDAGTNRQLWNGRYKRNLSDLIAVQSEIARDISEHLRQKLSNDEHRRVTESHTSNTEAFKLYLRGRYHWNKRTREDISKSIGYFEQAIAADPGYALAHAGLADAYNLLPTLGAATPQESFPKAKAAAIRALEIDDKLPEAHTGLAFVRQGYDWDFAGAEDGYRRAVELNPNYATARHWYSRLLLQLGRFEEAVVEAKRAQELDPLSLIISTYMARVFRDARRYDEAMEQARKTIALDKNFAHAHYTLATIYEEKGMFEEAITEFQTNAVLTGESTEAAAQKAAQLRAAYRKAGAVGYWRRRIAQMKEDMIRGYVSPAEIASIYARLGQDREAFAWLEKAYREHDALLVWLKTYPAFDGLRSDPRFTDLLRRVGFTS